MTTDQDIDMLQEQDAQEAQEQDQELARKKELRESMHMMTRVSPEVGAQVLAICDKFGFSVFHALRMLLEVMLRMSDDQHNLTPELMRIIRQFVKARSRSSTSNYQTTAFGSRLYKIKIPTQSVPGQNGIPPEPGNEWPFAIVNSYGCL